MLNLAAVGQLDLLRKLYAEVLIPPMVASELNRNGFPVSASTFPVSASTWIRVTAPRDLEAVSILMRKLDPGESEAIALALEQRADLLLIDERRGWRIAMEKGIPSIALLGVLAEAKSRGVIHLCRPILDEMRRCAGFWIGKELRSKYLISLGESE